VSEERVPDLAGFPPHALRDAIEEPAGLAERRLFPAREGREQKPATRSSRGPNTQTRRIASTCGQSGTTRQDVWVLSRRQSFGRGLRVSQLLPNYPLRSASARKS
jgi:hypothetical protein